tara:strand:+ start:843 stop:1046 length:204 start_codon:yes stop_codon:yes gene_type:complete
MKQINKYKMSLQTYEEYLGQGIFINMQKPKWGKNRSAIIKGTGYTTKTKTMPVEIEVLGYYATPVYK